jgi:hypothetical protein
MLFILPNDELGNFGSAYEKMFNSLRIDDSMMRR